MSSHSIDESKASTSAPLDVVSLAAKAMSLLAQLSALIPFDDPTAKELQAAHGTARVPSSALTIASSILSADPARFPDFNAEITKTALLYDRALSPVVLELQQILQRTTKTVANRRGQGAAQTFALYHVLKGVSRISENKATLVQQKQLGALLKTNRKVRATSVTEAELQLAKKGMKATKKAKVKAEGAAAASAEAERAAAMEAAVLGAGNGGSGAAAAGASTAGAGGATSGASGAAIAGTGQ